MFKELKEGMRDSYPSHSFRKEKKKRSDILKHCFLFGNGGRLILCGFLFFAEVLGI
jgi:hypothetical protein